jgi:hypothetical protein
MLSIVESSPQPRGGSRDGLVDREFSPDESQILYGSVAGHWLVDNARNATTRLIAANQFPVEGRFDATGQNIFYSRGIRPYKRICSAGDFKSQISDLRLARTGIERHAYSFHWLTLGVGKSNRAQPRAVYVHHFKHQHVEPGF